jgi:hypothetical protein
LKKKFIGIVFLFRYIELFPSTYDEAKRRIMNDARSNARQFVGEDEDDNQKINNTNNNDNNNTKRNSRSRSRSRQRSRSTSRGNYWKLIPSCFFNIIILDHRQRETKRRHSPTVSPPPRSRRKKNKRFNIK